MSENLPVYNIRKFKTGKENDFYVNHLSRHVKEHHFTNLPHKHDFYLVMLVTKGSGTHEIDFEKHKVAPGTLFMLKPGQMHYWKLSPNIEGFVFFHSKNFYEEGFVNSSLKDFAFYGTAPNRSIIKL